MQFKHNSLFQDILYTLFPVNLWKFTFWNAGADFYEALAISDIHVGVDQKGPTSRI
jgi:hypothetical protein